MTRTAASRPAPFLTRSPFLTLKEAWALGYNGQIRRFAAPWRLACDAAQRPPRSRTSSPATTDRRGGLAEGDAAGADGERALGGIVAAGPGLQDGERAAHRAVAAVVAEHDRVVGQVRDRESRQGPGGQQAGCLVGGEQADALPGEPLCHG